VGAVEAYKTTSPLAIANLGDNKSPAKLDVSKVAMREYFLFATFLSSG